mmetsp:Transcript_6779/g.9930  ORF Transcript_6779/g.9930 Transcript_6779/m.9930 type:complete len:273 (+) Transcript_6779:938-1756(+)
MPSTAGTERTWIPRCKHGEFGERSAIECLISLESRVARVHIFVQMKIAQLRMSMLQEGCSFCIGVGDYGHRFGTIALESAEVLSLNASIIVRVHCKQESVTIVSICVALYMPIMVTTLQEHVSRIPSQFKIPICQPKIIPPCFRIVKVQFRYNFTLNGVNRIQDILFFGDVERERTLTQNLEKRSLRNIQNYIIRCSSNDAIAELERVCASRIVVTNGVQLMAREVAHTIVHQYLSHTFHKGGKTNLFASRIVNDIVFEARIFAFVALYRKT